MASQTTTTTQASSIDQLKGKALAAACQAAGIKGWRGKNVDERRKALAKQAAADIAVSKATGKPAASSRAKGGIFDAVTAAAKKEAARTRKAAAKKEAPARKAAAEKDLATLGNGIKGGRPLRLAVYAGAADMVNHLAAPADGAAIVAACDPSISLVASTAQASVWKAVAARNGYCPACRVAGMAARKAQGVPLWQLGKDEKRPTTLRQLIRQQAAAIGKAS